MQIFQNFPTEPVVYDINCLISLTTVQQKDTDLDTNYTFITEMKHYEV